MFSSKTRLPRKFFRSRNTRLELECLENRVVPSTWMVTNANATGTGSLAWAVGQANTDSSAALIQFDPSFFNTARTITITATLTLNNTSHPINIDGSGAGPITVSGGGTLRDFIVNSGVTATLANLTITGGSTNTNGGGIQSTDATLTLNSCILSNNSATQQGGGIYGSGVLTVDNSTITSNRVTGGTSAYFQIGGGGICWTSGTLTVKNASKIQNNTSTSNGGGVEFLAGSLEVDNSTIQGNSAGRIGGGVYSVGMVKVDNCTITGNSGQIGGGIYLADGTLTVQNNTTVASNTASTSGGGIAVIGGSATITDSSITSNNVTGASSQGGGIYNNGTLTMNQGTISGNSAGGTGGGIYSGTGTLTLADSSVSGNSATNGGGVYVAGGVSIACTDVVWNVAGNVVPSTTNPVPINLPSGTGRILSFLSVTGLVGANASLIRGGDGAGWVMNSPAINGISGILAPSIAFLMGVFLDGQETGTQPAPPSLNFNAGGLTVSFLSISPLIDQTFFIGDGLTGTGTGTRQQFLIPDSAKVLLLGICDTGVSDNVGAFYATPQINGIQLGSATLTNCTISANTASNSGGGIYDGTIMTVNGCTITGNSALNGGGICNNSATLAVTGSTISSNTSTRFGGGLSNQDGSVTLQNCTFNGNAANVGTVQGGGGAIYNQSSLTGSVIVDNCLINSNTASNVTANAEGGGILNRGNLTVRNGTVISGNSATNDSGGIYTDGLAATVMNSSVQNNSSVSGGGIVVGVGANGPGRLTVQNSTISNNSATGTGLAGGGVVVTPSTTATFMNSSITGNSTAGGGGGFYNGGNLTLQNCQVNSNVSSGGGGIGGGGIVASGGSITVLNCTLSGNTGSFGAVLDNRLGSQAVIMNSTLAGNTCNGGNGGGAIGNFGAGTNVTLNHVTIANNSSTQNGGGIYNTGTATLVNTIVASNSATLAGPDIDQAGGTIVANYSLIGNASFSGISPGNGNILNPSSSGLGTLGNNGGTPAPTTVPQTIPLVPGSPAIDTAGPDTQLNAAITDNGTTSIAISNMAVFAAAALPNLPSGYFTIQVDLEEMLVTTLAPGGGGLATLTVVRGSNGTTAVPHANAARVYLISDQRGSLPKLDLPPFPNMGAVNIGKNLSGVTISPTSLNLMVGGSDTYTVVLTSQPNTNVTITPLPNSYQTVQSTPPIPLIFTPADWNIPQTVIVTANPDLTGPGPFKGTIRHTATSSDTSFQGISVANVTVNITQAPGVFIQPKTITIIEAVASATYTVQLHTPPAADVTINCSPGSGLTVDQPTLTFTSANWNVPQVVTVTAPNDGAYTGFRTGTITNSATSSDANYNGVVVASVAVNILDNDGYLITGTQGDDSITVTPSADLSNLLVAVNGQISIIPVANVTTQLIINAGNGNDNIKIYNPIVPVLVNAGLGTDSLTVSGQTAGNNFLLDNLTLTANSHVVTMYSVENLTVNGLSNSDAFAVTTTPDPSIKNISFNGGLGNDSLTGPDTGGTWKITGSNSGLLNNVIKFAAIENLTGGSGDDTFSFSPGKNVTGKIDGGGGTDVLDNSLFTTPLTFNLQAGTATGTGGIASIETILAGKSTSDKLIGPDGIQGWNITAKNAGNVSGTFFQNIENLTGGSGDDTFIFADGVSLTGKLDGDQGSNALDYAAYSTGISVNLQSKKTTGIGGTIANVADFTGPSGLGNTLTAANKANAWTISAPDAGTLFDGAATFTFDAFPNLTGGAASDTFTGTGSWTGKLDGGLGVDTLVGTDSTDHAWNVTKQNAGTYDNQLFVNVENLKGGDRVDTFTFAAGQKITGKINGGAGSDVLDYTAFTTSISVNVQTGKATSVAGIQNLEQFLAGSHSSNFLTAPNLSNAWNLTATNAGTIANTGGTNTFNYAFQGFQNLTGGSLDDTFTLGANSSWDGYLQGGLGNDTLTGTGTWTATTFNGHKFGSIENHP